MRIQISTRIFDFNVSLELSIGNQNACRTSNSSSTWNFDLKLQNEIGNWNSKMRFHIEVSNWSCNIESVNWNAICNFNLQLRLKTSTCNWMRSFDRFKFTFNLEFWPEISTRNLDYKFWLELLTALLNLEAQLENSTSNFTFKLNLKIQCETTTWKLGRGASVPSSALARPNFLS